ncbi:hypothetical protein INS49_013919 [Diaporthe citri]|uniref:uncharacterized protein n=1 Tax=Diaporthe citri TaxID=83186 RepID=UPI001C804893|nr:uncharacterized protein INS49_013919 [Diaporthe citri]KAG6358035.1 hypothetical protein INS49_013919 [Diaporthe citri]
MTNIQRGGKVIAMAPMSQLQDAKCPEDDWTGLRDRAERRKRQNRLNVRAHRRRKAAGLHSTADSTAVIVPPTRTEQTVVRRKTRQSPNSAAVIITTTSAANSALTLPIACDLSGRPVRPAFSFPLSRDHLISIIELNVYRASLTNIYILGAYSLLCDSECGYAVNNSEPPLFPWAGYQPSGNIPESLRPTPLQRSTPHEVWIDILPSARMRDNAIVAVAEGRLRNEDLCADILRGICGEGKGCGEDKGRDWTVRIVAGSGGGGDDDAVDEARLIVWKDPWDPSGWEVTEGFLRKWGFLLRGDGEDDMVRATNRWRALRGEDPIVWEVE